MINYKDIVQGSQEWFNIKWGKIGGTKAKGLFVDSDTLFIDILSQKLEEFDYDEDSFSSSAMDRGSDLEPFARGYLNKYTGLVFKETGWLQSEDNELLGISPDGITEDEEIQCEIKCFGRKKHTEILINQEIPGEYIHQCIHAFTVNPKLNKLYFIAFRPESTVNSFVKEITLDSMIDIGFTKTIGIEQYGKKGQKIKSKFIKEPKLMKVSDILDISKQKAEVLLEKINNNLEQIKF